MGNLFNKTKTSCYFKWYRKITLKFNVVLCYFPQILAHTGHLFSPNLNPFELFEGKKTSNFLEMM